ncbi:hypothetical protein PILCRDRAFT_101231 [Piloderma croceum F 1598]|uniref:Uncharacterized protein n=1 Tax=Piloderma croceum (strain F 1598) TaxID=765440 RepID=A0A0C3G6G9_PILCF|nr:hypothetical protein PILCRDRAFT_101231 [Piloderma croceum F 1598]
MVPHTACVSRYSHTETNAYYSQCMSRTIPTSNQPCSESTGSKRTPTTSGAALTSSQIRVDQFANGTVKTLPHLMPRRQYLGIFPSADRSLLVMLMAKRRHSHNDKIGIRGQ